MKLEREPSPGTSPPAVTVFLLGTVLTQNWQPESSSTKIWTSLLVSSSGKKWDVWEGARTGVDQWTLVFLHFTSGSHRWVRGDVALRNAHSRKWRDPPIRLKATTHRTPQRTTTSGFKISSCINSSARRFCTTLCWTEWIPCGVEEAWALRRSKIILIFNKHDQLTPSYKLLPWAGCCHREPSRRTSEQVLMVVSIAIIFRFVWFTDWRRQTRTKCSPSKLQSGN